MPDFTPDIWNHPDVVMINNCYNYAVDDLQRPTPGQLSPAPAEPGARHEITAGTVVNAEPDGNGYTLYVDYSCAGIRTACLADNLRALKRDGTCAANCWRVAMFVRHFIEGPRAISGTPHFVREDSHGVWSHKPGLPVTQQQYNRATRAYSGPPITDPSQDNVGPQLEFCGYLCCGPHTRVSGLDQRKPTEVLRPVTLPSRR